VGSVRSPSWGSVGGVKGRGCLHVIRCRLCTPAANTICANTDHPAGAVFGDNVRMQRTAPLDLSSELFRSAALLATRQYLIKESAAFCYQDFVLAVEMFRPIECNPSNFVIKLTLPTVEIFSDTFQSHRGSQLHKNCGKEQKRSNYARKKTRKLFTGLLLGVSIATYTRPYACDCYHIRIGSFVGPTFARSVVWHSARK